MCGIAGINSGEKQVVENMLKSLRHRGPDDSGGFFSTDFSVGINRLSIIDVNGAPPPHWNETHTCCVVCNGEIYNYHELKAALQQKGHQFCTQSDTEVIVHLYEEYGEHAPEHLRGMFAFAVYDVLKKQLLLARDRFGEKPLLYYQKDDQFAFASETNAFLALPDFAPRLNTPQLAAYLRFGFVPEPDTLLRDIYSIPPGHILRFSNGESEVKPWFTLSYPKENKFSDIASAAEAFEEVWKNAVRYTMQSDVPVGALLSGGLDSSAIVAAMADMSDKPVKTFHVRIGDGEKNESNIAKLVATHFGTSHTEIDLPQAGFSEDLFYALMDHTGFPFPDAAAIPFYLISKAVRKEMKVVLSGDGGDEMLGGYDYYRTGMQVANLRKIPAPFREIMLRAARGASAIPALSRGNILRKVIKGLDSAGMSEQAFLNAHFSWFTRDELQQLHPGLPLCAAITPHEDLSTLRQLMWWSTTYNLPLDMLVKTDRMSMANSLEVRAPFLDADIYTFAASLPDSMLSNQRQGKLILRQMLKDKLPNAVLHHPKTGLTTPLHQYWNDEFRAMATSLITDPGPLDVLLDKKTVLGYLKNGLEQTADNGQSSLFRATHQLWLLVQLYGWVRRYNVQV